MAGPMDSADEAGLWRRWRSAADDGLAHGTGPDALALAAHAEDRLAPEATAAVAAWLADNPQAAQDVLAARQVRDGALPPAPEAIVARAAALVGGDAQVLAFRPRTSRPRRWRGAVGWGAIAASVLVASLAGFATGNDTFATLAGRANASLSQELLDPPTGLFNGADEDSSI